MLLNPPVWSTESELGTTQTLGSVRVIASGSELVTIGVSKSGNVAISTTKRLSSLSQLRFAEPIIASVSSTASGVKQGKTESPVTLFAASVVAASRVTRVGLSN